MIKRSILSYSIRSDGTNPNERPIDLFAKENERREGHASSFPLQIHTLSPLRTEASRAVHLKIYASLAPNWIVFNSSRFNSPLSMFERKNISSKASSTRSAPRLRENQAE